MATIHGVNASPFVRKVRVFLAEKGLRAELEPVMPFAQPPGFKEISPLLKIPVYQDGDYVLPDSSCICAYLERVHPEPPLYPSEPRDFGRALFYEEYADTRMAEVMTPIFYQRVVMTRVMKQKADDALVAKHMKDLVPPVFDYLEGELGGGEGIVGERFSIADLSIGTFFVNHLHADEEVDAGRWPRLASWVERTLARPSFRAAIEEEQAAFAAM